jgi:uncharacterized protein YllA (UPF0747 family)
MNPARRSLFSWYLESGLQESPFFPAGLGAAPTRIERTRAAAARPVDAALIAALRAHNEGAARRAHLDALARGAATVVTGQQVGLFLGPLYTFYKAATAVAVARALAAESGVPCVPVFWLATEDHDFAEIARCTVAGRRLALPVDDARVSVAHRRLGPEVTALVDALGEAIADQPHAAEVRTLFAEHYVPGAPPARAFAAVLARLFDELVLIDPRDPAVARLAAPVVRRAIADADELERLLAARGEALRAAGFDEQVRPRPGFTLAFVHPDGAEGPRHRLPQGARPPEDPLQLSTSALLRPLVQDALLPTAAYVGGPAEIGYLAQVAPLYPRFDLRPPLVVPRARFRLIPPAARRLLETLGLTPADAERADLVARVAPPSPGAPDTSWLAELEARLAGCGAEPRDVARARRSFTHALERLARRQQHAAALHADTAAGRARRLQAWLFPDGQPQERVESLAWFAAHAGPATLTARVGAAINEWPLNNDVKDLWL